MYQVNGVSHLYQFACTSLSYDEIQTECQMGEIIDHLLKII